MVMFAMPSKWTGSKETGRLCYGLPKNMGGVEKDGWYQLLDIHCGLERNTMDSILYI